ncbi:MAG TPA: glucose 1-dehydrogenase [Rhizomicrobium sp.]|nr:glucose 1-dehydrogenase [Rhizomicrobium sp.]
MGRLSGKVALVTGAASGIGKGCAVRLAQEGACVIATDIDVAMGESCVTEITRAGGTAIFLRHDVASEENWIAVIAETKSRFGRLDVLVNNAGIAIAGQITELSLADWKRQIGINLDGVFLGTKHGLPLMREGGGGSIINIASTVALTGSGNMPSYSATKGGVRAFTKSVALQCAAAKDGVRVNAIYPGIIDTPVYGKFEGAPQHGEGGANTKHISRDPEALSAKVVPLGVPGQPEDIAAGVVYLASDEARYVTGAELVIAGGLA